MHRLIPSLVLAIPFAALASTIVGNPNVSIVLAEGDDVYVHSVVGYKCAGGSQTLPVDLTFDELDSEILVFDETEYCDVVVRVKWTPSSSLEPVAVTGFTALDLVSSGGAVSIELDKTLEKATLN